MSRADDGHPLGARSSIRVVERAATVDPAGRRVVLDEEGWAHIVDGHGEMRKLRVEILAAGSRPYFVPRDPAPRRLLYGRNSTGPSRWIRVAVDFGTDPPRIVTAFA